MKIKSSIKPPEMISASQIQRRIHVLARRIQQSFDGQPDWAIIAILNGSYVFLADLGRALHKVGAHPQIDFLAMSSYRTQTRSSGRIRVERLFKLPVRRRAILLVDDILDSGRTLALAHQLLKQRGAQSVQSCVLLDKPDRRVIPFQADFVGFTIPDRFVAGYGLDLAFRYRNLPGIIDPSAS